MSVPAGGALLPPDQDKAPALRFIKYAYFFVPA